jgi:hypothetical protein
VLQRVQQAVRAGARPGQMVMRRGAGGGGGWPGGGFGQGRRIVVRGPVSIVVRPA